MKKRVLFVAAVIAVALAFVPDAYAGGDRTENRVGLTVGFNVSGMGAKDIKSENVMGYNIGVTAYCPVGLGFAIQPSALYLTKGLSFNTEKVDILSKVTSMDMNVNFVEIPVQLQWGPDLLFFRPYVFAEPFVGYGINVRSKIDGKKYNTTNFTLEDSTKIGRWEYGLGLGFGIQIWRLQASAKYFWNFGQLVKANDKTLGGTVVDHMLNSVVDNKSFDGIMIQAAILF